MCFKCVLTGVVSSGVVMGVQALFNFTPLPKSKSQIFTGDTYKHKPRYNYYNTSCKSSDLECGRNNEAFKSAIG